LLIIEGGSSYSFGEKGGRLWAYLWGIPGLSGCSEEAEEKKVQAFVFEGKKERASGREKWKRAKSVRDIKGTGGGFLSLTGKGGREWRDEGGRTLFVEKTGS